MIVLILYFPRAFANHASPAVLPCARSVRVFRSRKVSSSSEFGGGVSFTESANFISHPVFARTWSRVTPGCSEVTVNSLLGRSTQG